MRLYLSCENLYKTERIDIKANPCSQCGIFLFGYIKGICLFELVILQDTIRALQRNCNIPYQIEVLDTKRGYVGDCDILFDMREEVYNTFLKAIMVYRAQSK